MASKSAVVIITDDGFLLPSIVLATSIARDARYRALCDVLVFVLDVSARHFERVRRQFACESLTFHPLSSEALGLPTKSDNFTGHVPVAALARLIMNEFVPSQYENIVYLDGDVSVAGDISPLLSLRLPHGAVAAVTENFILLEGPDGSAPNWLHAILSEVGLSCASDYFNSGVMAFRADTWRSVGPTAMAYYRGNERRCRHHDQSALNAVIGGRWLRLGLGYNFQSFFAPVVAAGAVRKRLLHFSSMPKPWMSATSPWDPRLGLPYQQLALQYPALFPHEAAAYGSAALYDRVPGLRQIKRQVRGFISGRQKGANLRRYILEENFLLE
nr:glycosyltransferase [uncultured Brevundimonas sp.]